MVEVRTDDSLELPNEQDGVKDSTVQNTMYNRRIDHTTTVIAVNNRFVTKCTLDIQLEKKDSVINSPNVYRNIFDEIKQMDDTTAIITQYNLRITNSNKIPIDKDYKTLFPDQGLCTITKRMYVPSTLESNYSLAQLKHG